MFKSSVITWSFVWIFSLHCLGGCAYLKKVSDEKEETPADLMSEGMEALEKGYSEAAIEAFQKIKDRYPYSKFVMEAELRMGDALYKRGYHDEAFDAYNQFERLHPKNENIPYVIYQKGMCHFDQVTTLDRDQSHTLLAKREFERLIKNFPETEYTFEADRNIRECYIKLAEHELYVGGFYFKKKKFHAASGRYRYLLESYPDLGQYHKAIERLKKCTENLALAQNDDDGGGS